ncbi:hypothetical protein [Butyrivibrio sp. VCD2006]|uniref:hypothetical protein n=1 Tax=Butyrivibrio sp. VCD2006 TaxID=1280664 RepID=UPI000408EFD3|nr:hypothetical protein [Butyrivibrio sp. VCD2006]
MNKLKPIILLVTIIPIIITLTACKDNEPPIGYDAAQLEADDGDSSYEKTASQIFTEEMEKMN